MSTDLITHFCRTNKIAVEIAGTYRHVPRSCHACGKSKSADLYQSSLTQSSVINGFVFLVF